MATSDLPTGTVTFLFTDIVDSTPLWERHGEAMRAALTDHDAALRAAVAAHGGMVVKTTGDGVHAVFASPVGGLLAALAAQRTLAARPQRTRKSSEVSAAILEIRIRAGLHTGEAELREGDYYGSAVNRAARIMSIGHGGQTLLSAATAELVAASLPEAVVLRDLGRHRLKGLARPEHVFQANAPGLPRDFPPLRSLTGAAGNLPEPLTGFIGRERELAEVRRLLETTRLLTLTGPGGAGKTRLALETGRRVRNDYGHGAWLVELAALADPELTPSAVAAAFELAPQPGAPILSTLIDYLRGKHLLLILDNCEHLVGACARLAAGLLPSAPDLIILASSREGLGAPGETTYHLPALSTPPPNVVAPEAVAGYEAVQLFVVRASAAQPSFALTAANAPAVGRIVRRLDGIPLAIELAAARVKMLKPAQIAERLDDRFRLLTGGSRTALPRQQTLRALIDWSYDLLNEQDRWFFRRLAVFSGGWTLEAAESLVQTSEVSETSEVFDALELLSDLVNKSLAQIDESGDEVRYFYLETIRQYARDKLYEAGETPAARDSHFAYYLRLAGEDFGDDVLALSNLARLDRLERELDNLRAALEWGAGRDPLKTVELLRYLTSIWSMLGLSLEAKRQAEALLVALDALPPAGEAETAERRRARALALSTLATAAGPLGEVTAAYAAVTESIAILRDDGSMPLALAGNLIFLALACAELGRPEDGYEAAGECYEIGRALGSGPMQNLALTTMAQLALMNGDLAAATSHLAEARRMRAQLGPIVVVRMATVESVVARAAGDFAAARRALEEGVEALSHTRHRGMAGQLDSELGHILRQTGDLDGATAAYRRTIKEWQDLGYRVVVAGQLECFAYIARARGEDVRAARLLGAAEALRELIDNLMSAQEHVEYDAEVAALRERMGPAAFDAARQHGRALDMDAAIDFAVG